MKVCRGNLIKKIITENKGSQYEKLFELLNKGDNISYSGLNFEAQIISLIEVKRKSIIVVKNTDEMAKYKNHLSFAGKKVVTISDYTSYYIYQKIGRSNSLRDYYSAIPSILNGSYDFLIITANVLMQRLPEPYIYQKSKIKLKSGDQYRFDDIKAKLTKIGYDNLNGDIVKSQGEFSVRGDIIEIFPIDEQNPIRIEFFDDEIEKISEYSIVTFERVKYFSEKIIYTARMALFSESEKKDLLDLLDDIKKDGLENSNISEIANELKVEIEYLGPDYKLFWLIPFMSSWNSNLIDYVPKDSILFFNSYEFFKESIKSLFFEFQSKIESLLDSNLVMDKHKLYYKNQSRIFEEIEKFQQIDLNSNLEHEFDNRLYFNTSSLIDYSGSTNMLIRDIQKYFKKKYKVFVSASNHDQINYLQSVLKSNFIKSDYCKDMKSAKPNKVNIIKVNLLKGVDFIDENIVIFGSANVFPSANRGHVDYSQEKYIPKQKGEYLVHDIHGIGIFEGIKRMNLSGYYREYITIRYKDDDILNLPIENAHFIMKYIGKDSPKLHRLGSKDFEKAKAKVKSRVKKLAFDLVRLYSERESKLGYKFSKDTRNQLEFEKNFEYEETKDQLTAIKEVKNDMESSKVMDRLICGDVGYGKTEVAIRAAFKAVENGKQVAILSPTTILSKQHFDVFSRRLNLYGFKIGILNRFQTNKQARQTISDLKKGKIDIISGTHRLLSKDIDFLDIGLLILDEEQKFGVGDKEKIKLIKKDVDTLTLSATPIPRTLHMSLIGIRDISIIETPPSQRFSAKTIVMPQNDYSIKNAISSEDARKGQVLIIHNYVYNIENVYQKIKSIVPDLNIDIAHGQMSSKDLDSTIKNLYENKTQVLIATTLIENGIDLPNANTLIVLDSDKFGLSQLYQLRGRVGRSNKKAHAYFFHSKNLSIKGEQRLSAIKEFSDLGSGFKLAMRDLEIRGAGDILGGEQHGHINKVGYNTYQKILSETIKEAKIKEKSSRNKEGISIKIKSPAYIPQNYLKDPEKRRVIQDSISKVKKFSDYERLIKKIKGEYGQVPKQIKTLMLLKFLENISIEIDVKSIEINTEKSLIKFKSKNDKLPKALNNKIDSYFKNFKISYSKGFILEINHDEDEDILDILVTLINAFTM